MDRLKELVAVGSIFFALSTPRVEARPRPVGAVRQELDLYQETSVKGFGGVRPPVPVRYDQLRAAAKRKLSRKTFDFIAGGAGNERTIEANQRALDAVQIKPGTVRGLKAADTTVSLYGTGYASPIFVAPTSAHTLLHRDGENATVRGAAAARVPLIVSSGSSKPVEEIARTSGTSPFWFQLYMNRWDDVNASLVARAERAGAKAIVVTVDNGIMGLKTRDLENGFNPYLIGVGLGNYATDPAFQRHMERPDEAGGGLGRPPLRPQTLVNAVRLLHNYPGGFWSNLRTRRPLKALTAIAASFSRPEIRWEDIAALRRHTRLPIVVKGIMRAEDARAAVRAGVDGIVVSNHGGRQIDGEEGALTALPGIVKAVREEAKGRELHVLFDSGVRNGSDVFKALALGASAVLVGRPVLFALGVGGEAGVTYTLNYYRDDLRRTMLLSGVDEISRIDASHLSVEPPQRPRPFLPPRAW